MKKKLYTKMKFCNFNLNFNFKLKLQNIYIYIYKLLGMIYIGIILSI